MIFSSTIGDIDLSKVVRLYPAVLISSHGESACMSLEWAEMNAEKIEILSFVLVFDFTLPSEKNRDKKEIHFETKDKLLLAMQEVAQFFEKN